MTLDGRVRNQETQRMPAQIPYAGDPNGVLEAAEGTFCWDTVGKVMYVNTDGATTWTTGFAPPTSPHILATTAALGPEHTVSGLTARQVLIATGATTALFRAIEDADIPASIARDSELHDAVTLAASLDSNLLSLSTQELGLDTQAANIVFAGPVSGGAAVPSFRSLVDADIPSSIARDSELHAAVTLAASLDSNLLSLSTQELGLDTQAANVVFAGPVSGGAAVPAFRALVDTDIPVHVLATTSGLGSQHSVSGLTARQVLIATGATTALFRAIEDADIPATIARDSELHDAVTLSAGIDTNLLSLTGQEIGLDTQVANIVFAGPVSGGAAAPAFRSLVDADIPATIARDSELHAAVTLAASLDSNLLSLAGQELGLDTQAANLVFAGPTSGAAAAPTFRSAVVADLPVGSAQYQFLMTGATPFAPVYTAVSALAGAGMTATAGVLNVIAANTSMTINADSLQVRLAATSGLQISTGLMIADTVAGAGLTIASKVLAVNVSGLGLSVTTDAVVLTSSSNPGAAAAIIASSSSGGVQLTRFGINTTPTTNGAIDISNGGWIGLSSSTARLSFNIATENYLSMDAANLVINQGAYDGALLTGISSDVAHGMTTLAGTDVYVELAKLSPTAGGLIVEGYTEDVWGVFIRANSTNGDTAKSTAATGAIGASASKKSGMGRADMGANENLFTIRNNATTRWIVDAEGDTHRDGTDNTFDQYNDAFLARAFDLNVSPGSVIDSKFDTWVEYERADLIAAGILHQSGFYNESRLLRLAIGAVWQMYVQHKLLEQHVLELEQKLLS